MTEKNVTQCAELEERIKRNPARVDVRELRLYRRFYVLYPQIRETVTPESCLPGKALLQGLSFSHFAELLSVKNLPLKITT